MPSKALWHAELALLPSGVVPRVLIEVEGERISALTPDTDPPPSASRLPGFTLPGLANAHSHAFHRALRGRTQRERGDFWSWRRRMYELAGPTLRIAAGIHSVRALHPGAMRQVASWAAERSAPLHLHLSEQRAENDECLAVTGLTPAALADRCGVLGPRTTAVHATCLSDDDIRRLGATRTTVCMCPTTERDLADGIGPAAALATAGSPLCV